MTTPHPTDAALFGGNLESAVPFADVLADLHDAATALDYVHDVCDPDSADLSLVAFMQSVLWAAWGAGHAARTGRLDAAEAGEQLIVSLGLRLDDQRRHRS